MELGLLAMTIVDYHVAAVPDSNTDSVIARQSSNEIKDR
jgi:hypothetical protein